MIIAIVQPATGNLQEISERFIEAVIKNNPQMRKQGNSTASTIGGVNALAATLQGPGTAGKTEAVTVHMALLPGSRFFYTITVVPEAEVDVYRKAFNRVVGSIEFIN